MKHNLLAKTLLILALLFSECAVTDDRSLEYKVKAGYLYNFTKFVTWPEIKATSFNLCLLGYDPFGVLIEPIQKKSAFDLPIRLVRLDEKAFLSNSSVAAECHILYLNGISNSKTVFSEIYGNLKQTSALVVGDGDAFVAGGGMIGFVNREGRIKLQINLQTAKQIGFKISAKLLEIAEIIPEENHD